MFAREVRVGAGGKVAAIVLGAALLAVVAIFLAFGFVLLIGLAVAGLLLGVSAAAYRALTGRRRVQRARGQDENAVSRHGLDPSREVLPRSD